MTRAPLAFALTVALLISPARPALAAERSAREPIGAAIAPLLEQLQLDRPPGLPGAADVALSVRAHEPELEGAAQSLLGLLSIALGTRRLGGDSPRPAGAILALEPGAPGALDAAARARGAEFLIALEVSRVRDRLRIVAELRAVDLGLWRPPPREVMARAEVLTERWPAEGQAAPPSTGPRFIGVPTRVGTIPGRVLALCSSPARGADPHRAESGELLFVLTREALTAYALTEEGLVSRGRLDLLGLERALERPREPLGGVVCGAAVEASFDVREVAFGSSDLASGHVVRFTPNGAASSWALVATLPGIPLGALEPGAFLTARSDGGRGRLDRAVRVSVSASGRRDGPPPPSVPALEIVASVSGARAFAVLEDYRFVALSDDLASGTLLGSSGVGISLLEGPTPAVVLTSSAARQDDRLRLWTPKIGGREAMPMVDVPGRVLATTGFGSSALLVARVVEPAHDTDLLRVRIDLQGDTRP